MRLAANEGAEQVRISPGRQITYLGNYTSLRVCGDSVLIRKRQIIYLD